MGRDVFDDILAGYFRHYPVDATSLGHHAGDGVWPDLTEQGRLDRIDWIDASRRALESPAAELSHDAEVDRRVLLAELAALRFNEESLREPAWDPLSYVYLFGEGLFSLLARDFAPRDVRLRNAVSRLQGLPAALDAARANLSASDRPRPVSRLHTGTAVDGMAGVAELANDVVTEARDLHDPALEVEAAEMANHAIAAIDRYVAWMRDELLPLTDTDFRLGPELYASKFRHTLQTELTPNELERLAMAALDHAQGEMFRLTGELWDQWTDSPRPRDDRAATRSLLDRIVADHPDADGLVEFCRAEKTRLQAFLVQHDLLDVPDEPLEVIDTPTYLRSFAGAMLLPSGPLDTGVKSYFAITPPDDDWSPERQESYLRENNSRLLRLTTIHEAVPGHYLQLTYANRVPSMVRAVFGSGTFCEGWAVYITQVMMDLGFGAEDPALMLVHWKYFLRTITNAILDIRVHTGELTEDEAVQLLVDEAFQEEAEARVKWNRARLSSTQLSEYFLGSTEMHAVEAEARRRTAANGTEFTYRPFLESVLAHGSPSFPILRQLLFGSTGSPG